MSTSEEIRTDAHVLDPLSEAEVGSCVAVARDAVEVGPRTRFVAISTAEPERRETHPRRRAEVLLHRPEERSVVRLIVDLEDAEAVAVETLPGVEPAIGLDEVERFERRDARRPAVPARRCDAAASRTRQASTSTRRRRVGTERRRRRTVGGRRAILAYARPSDAGEQPYAHPLEGVFGVVDLNTGEIVHFEDREPVPVPDDDGEYRAERIKLRDDVRPIHITQPEGPSFAVDGQRGALAEVEPARRLQQPRGARPPRHRLRGRRHGPSDPPPRVNRRDDRSLRRSGSLLPVAARHRRAEPGDADQLAGARLRLPRRHPLLRRRIRARGR